MQKMNVEELKRHVELVHVTTTDEKDELLTDLLVAVYKTKPSQDN